MKQPGTGIKALILKMIKFIKNDAQPILEIHKLYTKALKSNQKSPEAFIISTSCNNMPSSRCVNIKEIKQNKFIFFSNYRSRKGMEINKNKNVAGLFYWNSINCQIRIEGRIKKLSTMQSDSHFINREYKKNIAAISSNQSNIIDSYREIEEKYEKTFQKYKNTTMKRPKYWGGYEINPNSLEIWIGNKNRLNYRVKYILERKKWNSYILEP